MAAQLGFCPETLQCFCTKAEISLTTGLSNMVKSRIAEQAFDQRT